MFNTGKGEGARRVAKMYVAHNLGQSRTSANNQRGWTAVQSAYTQGNVSFRDSIVYSYRHWPFAQFVKNDKGQQAVMFRSETYSPSTTGHQNEIRSVIRSRAPSVPVFDVWPAGPGNHRHAITQYRSRELTALDKALAARTYTVMHVNNAATSRSSLLEYCEFFGLTEDFKTYSTMTIYDGDAEKIAKLETRLVRRQIEASVGVTAYWRAPESGDMFSAREAA